MRLIGLEDQHCLSLSKGTCNVFGREHIAVSFGVMWGEHLNSILASDNIAQKGHSRSALLEVFHVQSQGLWTVMGNFEHS